MLFSLHSSVCSAGGHRAWSKSPKPRPPPFVTYRKEKSQNKTSLISQLFLLDSKMERKTRFLHLLLLRLSLMCLLWSFTSQTVLRFIESANSIISHQILPHPNLAELLSTFIFIFPRKLRWGCESATRADRDRDIKWCCVSNTDVWETHIHLNTSWSTDAIQYQLLLQLFICYQHFFLKWNRHLPTSLTALVT